MIAPTVYLAGEIHTRWRQEVMEELAETGTKLTLVGPITDHEASDECGTRIFGCQGVRFWNDQLGAGVNAVRTRVLLERSDLVLVRFAAAFGEWNGALDAGRALALGKPLITLHPADLDHALKEVDRAALAVCRDASQVASVLRYAFGNDPYLRTTLSDYKPLSGADEEAGASDEGRDSHIHRVR